MPHSLMVSIRDTPGPPGAARGECFAAVHAWPGRAAHMWRPWPNVRTKCAPVCSHNPTVSWNQQLGIFWVSLPNEHVTSCYNGEFVIQSILSILAVIRVFFRSRSDLALEVLALRQQVAVLKRKQPRRFFC